MLIIIFLFVLWFVVLILSMLIHVHVVAHSPKWDFLTSSVLLHVLKMYLFSCVFFFWGSNCLAWICTWPLNGKCLLSGWILWLGPEIYINTFAQSEINNGWFISLLVKSPCTHSSTCKPCWCSKTYFTFCHLLKANISLQ